MAIEVYKCPNGGVHIEFVLEKQNFSCDYCDSVFLEAEIKECTQKNRIKNMSEKQKKNFKKG